MSSDIKVNPPFNSTLLAGLVVLVCGTGVDAVAEESEAEIAKKLNNPIAAMISVPFQFNYDKDIGPTEKGNRTLLNIQPVIPIDLNAKWVIISRTIIPVIKLEDAPPGNDEDGIGNVLQSLWLSPKALTPNGWTWGAGPALSLRTATDESLGPENGPQAPQRSLSSRQMGGPTAP
jgi:hypothetical protein